MSDGDRLVFKIVTAANRGGDCYIETLTIDCANADEARGVGLKYIEEKCPRSMGFRNYNVGVGDPICLKRHWLYLKENGGEG